MAKVLQKTQFKQVQLFEAEFQHKKLNFNLNAEVL